MVLNDVVGMDCLLANGSAGISGHFNLALLFGLIILGGALGARLSQKIHVPQVVGCIVVGIFLGDVLGLITAEKINRTREPRRCIQPKIRE